MYETIRSSRPGVVMHDRWGIVRAPGEGPALAGDAVEVRARRPGWRRFIALVAVNPARHAGNVARELEYSLRPDGTWDRPAWADPVPESVLALARGEGVEADGLDRRVVLGRDRRPVAVLRGAGLAVRAETPGPDELRPEAIARRARYDWPEGDPALAEVVPGLGHDWPHLRALSPEEAALVAAI